MSPVDEVRKYSSLSFPRVSGDEPLLLGLQSDPFLFSPRERG